MRINRDIYDNLKFEKRIFHFAYSKNIYKYNDKNKV